MATLNWRLQWDVTLSGGKKYGGSVTTANTLTVSEAIDGEVVVGSADEITVWDASSSQIAAFEFIVFEIISAHDDVELQLTSGTGGTPVRFVHLLKQDQPFVLAGDDMLSNVSADFTGTTDQVDKIMLKGNGADNVTVRYLVTG